MGLGAHRLSRLKVGQAWVCTRLVHTVTTAEFTYVAVLLRLEDSFLGITHYLWANAHSASSSVMISDPWGGVYRIDVSFKGEHPTVSHTLHLDQLWMSVLISNYCQCKFLES